MSNIEQRLECLEEANDVLYVQNHILATTLKSLIYSLPSDMVNDTVESVQLVFGDALAESGYEGSPRTDLFHDVTYAFFREKDH